MKLTYATAKDAQARADKLHADMIATNALYAQSAALYDAAHPELGGTARWCFPAEVAGKWDVAVDERTVSVLTAQEVTAIGIAVEAIPIEDGPIAIDGESIG